MKKFFICLVLCSLFVFAGCGSNSEDPIYGDDTDSTDSQNNDENADTDKTDSDNTDSDNTDTDKTDSDNPDTDNPDTDNPDTDNPDTDNPDTDNPDTDNPDTDNPDTDNPDTDNPDTDNPDTDNPDTDNPDTDTEIECTGISLDTETFYAYVDGIYLGFVTDGVLGSASTDDMVFLGFYNGVSNGTYDLGSETNSNYKTCTECLRVFQDYNTTGQKIYFQENGTLEISEYDPANYGMVAVISAKLVESTFSNGESTPVENGACIEIEAGVANAVDESGKTDTCADIYDCFDTCSENDSECYTTCFYNSTAVARTQYNDLETCAEAHNCDGNYYCFWENCREQEEICGMKADTENYNIPYGQVTINGTFTYLHSEEETTINITDHALKGAFVTGTFGNNNSNIIDPTADPDKIFSYAKIAPFKDVPEEKNITIIQTYQEEGKTPTVHFVTTVTEPGDYTLGLGEWTTEARIFVSETNSDGERSCDHAFGIGNVTISAISWTTGATTISVSGSATLYSYKSAPHYGGDISGTEWVACDPKN